MGCIKFVFLLIFFAVIFGWMYFLNPMLIWLSLIGTGIVVLMAIFAPKEK